MKAVMRDAKELTNSGIDIIEDIPTKWGKYKLKFLCNIDTGNKNTQDANDNGKYPFFVRSPIVEHSDEYTFDEEGILVAGDGAGAGRVFHHACGKFAVHQRVYCLHNFNHINTSYLFYYLSNRFEVEMEKGSAQSTVPSIRLPMLKDFIVAIPPLDEQNLIVNYLDDRCSNIDAIIAEAKASIEEYKELKQAVIYEAVTKGTEKDVPLKDSGIYGWGNVPQHWQKGKMKAFIESVESGLSAITGDDSADESGNYVLRTSAVSSGEFKADEKKAVLNNALDRLVCPVEKDTLVMSRMNTAKMVGYCAYIAEEQPNTYLPDKLWKIKTKKTLMPKYAWYLINSNGPHEHFASIATGTSASMINITKTDLYAVDVVVPSVEEQLKITKHIDKVISKIDELCSEKQSLIADLEAYKKSLIYEVVTGKRKVVA